MMADWSSLPPELVQVIGDKLEAIEDYSSLFATCRSFRSSARKDQWRPGKVSQPPWLLLCCRYRTKNNNNIPRTKQISLLSMYKNKKRFSMDLPEIQGRRSFGTLYGWLVTRGQNDQLHLFNPLNRRRIALPEVTFNGRFRVILIKRPPNSYSSSGYDDYLVVTIKSNGYVKVMKPRTNTWETLCSRSSGKPKSIFDIVCYQGGIYGVGFFGRLIVCSNLDGPDPLVAEDYMANDISQFNVLGRHYLVESSGELLLIVRHISYHADDDLRPDYFTNGFEVYKLNQKSKKWIKMDDLGDRALFVGDFQAIALSSAENANCRSNCIYFTDDCHDLVGLRGGHDMGIYDYKEGTIEPFYEGADSWWDYSFSTWFIPSLT